MGDSRILSKVINGQGDMATMGQLRRWDVKGLSASLDKGILCRWGKPVFSRNSEARMVM